MKLKFESTAIINNLVEYTLHLINNLVEYTLYLYLL